jgi:hypothetical protein
MEVGCDAGANERHPAQRRGFPALSLCPTNAPLSVPRHLPGFDWAGGSVKTTGPAGLIHSLRTGSARRKDRPQPIARTIQNLTPVSLRNYLTMFSPRIPVSEFTARALEGHLKELESSTFFSMTDLHGILSGGRADHLAYGRELHRGLCLHHPEAAKEYRETLDADAALLAPRTRHAPAQTDSYAVAKLSQKFIDTVIREGKREADGADVLSDARRLHATLGAFIKAEEAKEDVRPRLQEIS